MRDLSMCAKEYRVAKGIYCVDHETRRHGVAKDRYFIIRIQINGKRPHQGIGWASEGWTLAKVQELVVEFKKAARTGTGPTTLAEMREEAEYNAAVSAAKGSVKDLFISYIADQQKRGRKRWKDVERVLLKRDDSAIKFFGEDTKAKDVTSRDVMLYLRTFYEKGSRGMANHVRVYLHGAFKFGIGNEFDYTRSNPEISFGIESNPVSSIPKDKESLKLGNDTLR